MADQSKPNAKCNHRGHQIDLAANPLTQTIVQPGENLSLPIFQNGFYNNPWQTWRKMGFTDVVKWVMTRVTAPLPNTATLDQELPVVKMDWEVINNPRPNDIQATWIGHASFLLQFAGVNFLCDPVFSQRCSPFQFAGPKRFRQTPCSLDELPPIDFVIISHNHYDHLDSMVVEKLGDEVVWIVPMGHKDWFKSMNVKRIVEMSWWDKFKVNNDVEVVCVPCQHWSKRTLMDDMRALWSSWVVQSKAKDQRVFFAGDSGYCSSFTEIGQKFGSFDLSLIPIGAYDPRGFMRCQHVDPEEAVAIHCDIKSKVSIGMHWGTFILTDEHVLEPPKRVAAELERRKMKADEFIVIRHGETWTASKHGSAASELTKHMKKKTTKVVETEDNEEEDPAPPKKSSKGKAATHAAYPQ